VRVTVGKAIDKAALALDAGFLGAASRADSLASATNTQVGVFGLGNEALIFVKRRRIHYIADVFAREIAVARGAETVQVCISNFSDYVCANTLQANIFGLAARQLRSQSGRIVVAANYAAEAWLFPQSQTRVSYGLNDFLHHDGSVCCVRLLLNIARTGRCIMSCSWSTAHAT
jgi:hypothetical protein